jgi:hypothetical protein
VTTVGDEENFSGCMAHLRAQTVSRRVEVIDRVAPMSAAFNEMIRRCRTTFYVQVDEDMLLFPHAIEALEAAMNEGPEDLAMVSAPLWDCETERPIQGVKIYRHAIVREFPYQNVLGCESRQLDELKAAGYAVEMLPLGDRGACLGEHGKHYTPSGIFVRWQRLLQKQIRCDERGLSQWPSRLLERYMESRNPVHLYALLGAIAGIVGESDGRELDFREPNEALERVREFFPADG